MLRKNKPLNATLIALLHIYFHIAYLFSRITFFMKIKFKYCLLIYAVIALLFIGIKRSSFSYFLFVRWMFVLGLVHQLSMRGSRVWGFTWQDKKTLYFVSHHHPSENLGLCNTNILSWTKIWQCVLMFSWWNFLWNLFISRVLSFDPFNNDLFTKNIMLY